MKRYKVLIFIALTIAALFSAGAAYNIVYNTITARTSIELGSLADTTITRTGTGDIGIEGNVAYRAGGTDVPVADGGTGASTLTDGGVLLGSGTEAVTAMSVLTDGQFIVGDGTTDPVAESGTTARTSLGVAIGTNVQAWDDDLDDIAALTPTLGHQITGDGTDWQVQSKRVFDVRDYGAVSGGAAATNTAAFIAADANAALVDGTVWFPPGIFQINATITLTAKRYIGSGTADAGTGTIIQQTVSNTSIFEAPVFRKVLIKGITFGTSALSVVGVTGIKQTTVASSGFSGNCTFDHLYFVRSLSLGIDVSMIKCVMYSCYFGSGSALNDNNIFRAFRSDSALPYTGNANSCYNCTFTGAGSGGTDAAIVLNQGIGFRFFGCTFDQGYHPWIYATDTCCISFQGCYFEQGHVIGSGEDYMIFSDVNENADTGTVSFYGCFATISAATDVNSFVRIGSETDTKVSFSGSRMVIKAPQVLCSDGVTDHVGLVTLEGSLVGSSMGSLVSGLVKTGKIEMFGSTNAADTEYQRLEFYNKYMGYTKPMAAMAVESSDSSVGYNSSELVFYTRNKTQHADMIEAGRFDNNQNLILSNNIELGHATENTLSAASGKLSIEGKVVNPMTAAGDIIYGGASGTGTRLGVGSNAEVLTLAAGVPVWAAAPGAAGGDSWGDAVDADILPTGASNTYDLGSADAQFKDGWFDGTLEADAITIAGTPISAGGAPTDATYITQTANGTLSAEQAMGALATGIVKNTTTTGVQSIAAAGTDYLAPNGDGSALTGIGDMVLANVQSVTGLKTFDTIKLAVKGSSTGITSVASANASATNYIFTIPAVTGTAYVSTGTDVPVIDGGTGVSTLPDGGLLIGNGLGDVEVVAAATTSQILVGGGASAAPVWGADIPTAVTIGSGYIYRAGGTEVPDADVADDITAGNASTVTNATLTTALTVNTGTVTLTGNVADSSVLTLGAGAVSVSGTNTGDNTVCTSGTATTATTLATTRTIAGVNFDGSVNIGIASTGLSDTATIRRTTDPKVIYSFSAVSPDVNMVDIKISFPEAMTVTRVRAICVGGTNVVGRLYEVDSDGDDSDKAGIDSADWTIGTTLYNDTSFTNPTLDADDWMQWDVTSVTGTVTNFSITVYGYKT